MNSSENPTLSVVIAIVSDTTELRAGVDFLAGCLEALSQQVDAPPIELIVPYHEAVDGIEDLRKQYSDVNFLLVPELKTSCRQGGGREHHDTLRARGLAAARSELVALVEDHAKPAEDWCANIVAAHREHHSGIGGAIENGIDRPLNWAVYFCDYGRYQNPLPSGESPFASDSNVSYRLSALESIRSTWEQSFREVVVNAALTARGEKVVLRPDIVVYQQRIDLRLGSAVLERFIWGRSYAATRTVLLSNSKRMIYAALSPLLPLILMRRMATTAWKRRRRMGKFVRSIHLIALLLACWSLGECVGYLRGECGPNLSLDAGGIERGKASV